MSIVLDNFGSFASGTLVTAELTLLSFAFALLVGVLIAAFRVSPVPPLRAFAVVWVEVLRNTPLIVLVFLFFFGLTKAGIRYAPFPSAVIVLSAYTSTFVAETVRSGISAVARGQAEAARALGLSFPESMRLVVLPQALRTVVAPLSSVFIALIKNSALAGVIAVHELTFVAEGINTSKDQPIPIFLGAAVGYLILALPSGWALAALEHRVALRR